MITAKSRSGFEIELEETALDNMELVDALADLNDGNALQMSRIVTLILGKDGKKRLYDHLRTADGRVPCEAVEQDIIDLMASVKDAKNSASSPN